MAGLQTVGVERPCQVAKQVPHMVDPDSTSLSLRVIAHTPRAVMVRAVDPPRHSQKIRGRVHVHSRDMPSILVLLADQGAKADSVFGKYAPDGIDCGHWQLQLF